MNRHEFISLVGVMPAKPDDYHIETLEMVDCGTYNRHKLAYDVEIGERITAYVCIPKYIEGKVPGIFCHHQHNGEFHLGKSEVVGLVGNPEQAYAAELAERGYVTFASDALAFEDRNWHDEPFLAEAYEGTARISSGTTFMAKLLHDISIGIDILSGISEVDGNQIGFIGHSYGGKMAFWAAAYDRRIRAAVANCGSTSLRRSLEKDAGILPELTIPGFLQHGDVVDVAKLADAAILISGTTDDVWSEDGQELYDGLMQDSKDAELRLYDDVHCFREDMRKYAYDFLNRKLALGK
ncbi:MAG: dienelactone hydrolase family protein [Candidatus Saccharimonadales bacterium]